MDGFNLYHSLDQAQETLKVGGFKWLNLRSFCASFLHLMGPSARLGPIHYFSALAKHMEASKPDVTVRHQAYLNALEESGVVVEMGHFKEKWITCDYCGKENTKHEEKESDVAIGVRLLDLLWSDTCDAAVLVSADSDLGAAIKLVRHRFPDKPIYSILPYGRGSFDLEALATAHFRAKSGRYQAHQFPDPVRCKDGGKIRKPADW